MVITYNLQLSRGGTLKHFYILKKETIIFMNEKKCFLIIYLILLITKRSFIYVLVKKI